MFQGFLAGWKRDKASLASRVLALVLGQFKCQGLNEEDGAVLSEV